MKVAYKKEENKMPWINYKESMTSKGFLITLRPSNDKAFSVDSMEINKLIEYIKNLSGFKYAIIAKEQNFVRHYETNGDHERFEDFEEVIDGQYHYHIMISTENKHKSSKKNTIIKELVNLFPNNLEGGHDTDVKFLNFKKRNVIAYCCKEDKNPVLVGDITQEYISNSILVHKSTKYLKPKRYNTACERDAAIREFCIDLMDKHNLKVNYYTRRITGDMTMEQFWKLMIKEGFLKIFSSTDMDRLETWIADKIKYTSVFPCYKPNLVMYKYNNCYIDVDNREILTIEEGKKRLKGEYPLHSFNNDLPNTIPEVFVDFVNTFNNPEEFRKIFWEILRSPKENSKCIYAYGPPGTGKSTIAKLFQYIFRDVVTHHAEDSGFSIASIATDPKFIIDESKLFEDHCPQINDYKKLINQEEFPVKRKNTQAILSIPKNGILTSNIYPPDPNSEFTSVHEKALLRRLHTILIEQKVTNPDPEFKHKLFKEVYKIIPYCTLTEEKFSGFIDDLTNTIQQGIPLNF